MLKTSHIIQKQTIEISFENIDNAIGVQNQIGDMFYEKLQPQMQPLFDELFGENYYVSLDKLEIDCGLLNQKNWEQEFVEQAIRQLKKELLQINKREIDLKKTREKIATETFFFFLMKGFLPWNKRFNTLAEIERQLSINKSFVSELKEFIVQHKNAAERLVYQFSKVFVSKIVTAIADNKTDELKEMNLLLESPILSSIDKRILDAAIITAFATNENINRKQLLFSFLLTKTVDNQKLQTGITEEEKQESGKKENNENEHLDNTIYISNAGLVLLHPFLQILFEELMLTKENQWIDRYSIYKAVFVLQYLVNGKEASEESNVMLNKLLCGIEIDEVLITESKINAKTKMECKALLKDVIKHWSILKNTSVEGLRDTFLQRNGKLSKVDNGWLLQVEQKTVDILLSHLPWGVSTIKLPWMKEMISVEWA